MRLRSRLHRQRLAGFVVPRADEHQSEHLAARSERVRWLTGFTGSAGTVVVLRDRAALFVDGRYIVQATAEVDSRHYGVCHLTREPLADWLASHVSAGDRLGYDPWLHTPAQVAMLEHACKRAGARAVAVTRNPVDAIWADQPPAPVGPVEPLELCFAGVPAAEKRAALAEALVHQQHDAAVLSAPESIAWLLNVRGADVPYAPLLLAFAIVDAAGGIDLFVDARKLTAAVRHHLGADVRVRSPEAFDGALAALGASRRKVLVDPDLTPSRVVTRLRRSGAVVALSADPCALPRARKNAVEQAGMRAAHLRDGAALTRFLAWLDDVAPSGTVSEIAAAEQLAALRCGNEHYRGPSFPTISGAGANGAIVHYRATPATDQRLLPGTLYLVDSGGHYRDGTTDVTRTVAIGTPTAEMRRRFTLVLKGHIALADARFPVGTTGPQLDALARQALWAAGLDYDHGTGHGVGHYLGVHEGPQRISKLPNRIALEPGMVLSNEPGSYKPGAFGIRIENLVLVVPLATPAGGEIDLLGFETLTLAPIDRRLIDSALLTAAEAGWLDAYHARVRTALTPKVDARTAEWLVQAASPISA